MRRADVLSDELFNDTGLLKSNIIKSKEVSGLSLNLLGSYYQLKHAKFKTKNKGSNRWHHQIKIRMSDFINDYDVVNIYCPIIYSLKKLHNTPIPFAAKEGKDIKKFFLANNLTPDLVDKVYKAEGKVCIVHEPTNLNYWHVELKLYDSLGNEVTRDENLQWPKSAKTYIVEHMLSMPLLKIPGNLEQISKKFSLNNDIMSNGLFTSYYLL